jgi:uncharacterized protein YjcR
MADEKKPIYIDENGNRRDPNRKGSPILCNAMSKRTRELCKNLARPNGKCRNHGGNNTGPKTPEGKQRCIDATRKANIKTGEYVPIWFDTLTNDEQDLLVEIPNDAEPLLEQEIKLTTIRERRMMQNIFELQDMLFNGEADISVQEHWKSQLKRDEYGEEIVTLREDGSQEKARELVLSSKVVVKDNPRQQLQSMEEALTRIQTHKAKLIELRHKLSEGNIDEADGSLDQLVAIIGKARNLRVEMSNKE